MYSVPLPTTFQFPQQSYPFLLTSTSIQQYPLIPMQPLISMQQLVKILAEEEKIKMERTWIISRYFTDGVIRSINNRLLMSGFLLQGALKAIQHQGIKDHEYIMGITYAFIPSMRNRTGDTQLFLTGNVKKNEASEITIIRKIEEEVKMTPVKNNSISYIDIDSGDIKWYSCPVSSLIPLNCPLMRPDTNTRNTNKKSQKVACLIHGTYKEMVNALSNLGYNYNETSNNGICGITCIKVSDVKKIIEIIKNNNYGQLDKFFWKSNKTCEYAFNGRYHDNYCTIQSY